MQGTKVLKNKPNLENFINFRMNNMVFHDCEDIFPVTEKEKR